MGLRHIVISPGSRSTPLTLAAAAFRKINKHVILDERSAGFTALGIGKATGKPAMLICTSGTAAANYYPAVIEARQSGVPLLMTTADRPPRLRNTDANQTINQINLYGSFASTFKDVWESEAGEQQAQKLVQIARQAFHRTMGAPGPGPVHLNFPFSKPLEPEEAFLEAIGRENEEVVENESLAFPEDQNGSFVFNDDVLYHIHESSRPLIVTGQLPANQKRKHLFSLAECLQAPILSEQGISDKDYAVQGFDGFLRNPKICKNLEPDLIFRFGSQPASRSLLLALERWQPNAHVFLKDASSPKTTSLPFTHSVQWNGKDFCADNFHSKSAGWIRKWKEAETHFSKTKKQAFKECNELTDGHIYEHFASRIPAGQTLFFSNSLPARDRSLFGEWGTQKTFTNRGASGIDGITSTALGIGLGLGQPGILFTGDLAFLHDTNALLNQKLLEQPLVIVVINNWGGSIFRMLPIAGHAPYFTSYFETPQDVDIEKLSESYGLPFKRIASIEDLNNFDLPDFVTCNERSLHIIECQTDPNASMQLRKKLWDLS